MIYSAFSFLGYDTLTSILLIITFCFIPVLLWSIFVSAKVNTTFSKFNKVPSKKMVTAAEAARYILDKEGLYDVQIKSCRGTLTDHYDPRVNMVFLSEATINSTSIAAIGVAAHEVGHAIQHARNYIPVKVRGALVPVINFANRMLLPCILLNFLVSIFLPVSSNVPLYIYYAIFAVYALSTLFSLVTLPCEFNASSRAKRFLVDLNIVDKEEIKGVSKVLKAAAMTYVASFAMSVVQLARILLIILSSRKRND